jgi:hypothetical protein
LTKFISTPFHTRVAAAVGVILLAAGTALADGRGRRLPLHGLQPERVMGVLMPSCLEMQLSFPILGDG